MKRSIAHISFFTWFFSTLVFYKDWSPYFLIIPILLMLLDILLNFKKKSDYIDYQYVLLPHIFMFITIYYILINFFEVNLIYIFYLVSLITVTVYIESVQLRRYKSYKIVFFSYLMSFLFTLFFFWQKEKMPVYLFVDESKAIINAYKNFIMSLLILSSLPLIFKTVYLYFKNGTVNFKKSN